jgi:parallel beta-helix repeat protein
MSTERILPIALLILLIATLGAGVKVKEAQASETIYIKADGRVEPSTANITSLDNITYAFTGNNYDSIVVERSDIIVDGNGYLLEGSGSMGTKGFYLSAIKNVTITKTNIKGFTTGVALDSSSNNTISGNNITMRKNGIHLDCSSNNTISGNNITNNYDVMTCCYIGIRLENSSHNNTISRNNVVNATITLYGSSENTIYGNSITGVRNTYGVYLEDAHSNSLARNKIARNKFGIGTFKSTNNTISNNNVTENNSYGIVLMTSSDMNSMSGNNVVSNGEVGILLWNSSYNLLRNNSMTDNLENFGVVGWELSNFLHEVDSLNTVNKRPIYYWLDRRNMTIPNDAGYVALINCTNMKVTNLNLQDNSQGMLLVYTTNSTITQNNIMTNYDGIWLYWSSNNKFYHNNLVDNTHQQVTIYGTTDANVWDDDLEGNYWSNYTGIDSDCVWCFDGIGDTSHVLTATNIDNHPLMGMFSSFHTSLGYYVDVVSNSTIEDFEYFESNSTIRILVSNMTSSQTYGFCRVSIPYELMNVTSISVTINEGDTAVLYPKYNLHDNGTHRWIYFAYEHSILKIAIIPEFSSSMILSTFIIVTLLIVVLARATSKRFQNHEVSFLRF